MDKPLSKAYKVSTPFSLAPSRLVEDVQECRFGFLYYLASALQVPLDSLDFNFTHLPNQRDYTKVSFVFSQIMKRLVDYKVELIVFDEAQRQLKLIEFIVKETVGTRPKFIITGTPPEGKDAVDYNGTTKARMKFLDITGKIPFFILNIYFLYYRIKTH